MSMVVGNGKVGNVWGFKYSLTKEEWARFDVEVGNGQKVKRDKGEPF
jgi:hypothetical protein